MSDTLLREDTITRVIPSDGDHDTFSHYAKKTDIERAIFDGVEIVALCGKKWRPEKDFTRYPVCPTCKEIYEGLSE